MQIRDSDDLDSVRSLSVDNGIMESASEHPPKAIADGAAGSWTLCRDSDRAHCRLQKSVAEALTPFLVIARSGAELRLRFWMKMYRANHGCPLLPT
jgi:hypothetical protein